MKTTTWLIIGIAVLVFWWWWTERPAGRPGGALVYTPTGTAPGPGPAPGAGPHASGTVTIGGVTVSGKI